MSFEISSLQINVVVKRKYEKFYNNIINNDNNLWTLDKHLYLT